MSDWQPIESAPKDGTRVLLWTGNLSALPTGTEMVWSATVGWWDREMSHQWIHGSGVDPTHWMPLPAPPTA